jgi:cytoskeleton protein RodZ
MVEPKGQKPKAADEHRAGRASAAPTPAESGVATSLRSARLAAGIDLHEAADSLRIRYPYLEAIEAGRFGDLPGPTYALGFVRAYAEYLGLDGKQMVRQFKEEGQAVSRRLTLIFPEPLQEGRFPGGAVLFIAVVFAAAVYGGWYYWEHRQADRTGEVPSVPTNLAKLMTAKPQASPQSAASVPTPAPEARTEQGGAGATAASSTDASRATAAPAKESTGAATGAPAVAVAPPPSGAAPATAAPTPETESVATATSAEPAPPVAAASGAPSGSGAAGEPAGSAPEQTAALQPAESHVHGSTDADSRITLNAKLDSWVEVRDSSGKVLWGRLLRAGESFRLPNQPGLVLATGNAGGLEVMVDGKPAPALGPIGQVRRNIRLDPDRLAAGIRTAP